MPAGPTHVSGIIDNDTVWFFAASPYIIDDTVIVAENAVLTIEPGTKIQSSAKGLVIKGGIIAKGIKSKLITIMTIFVVLPHGGDSSGNSAGVSGNSCSKLSMNDQPGVPLSL